MRRFLVEAPNHSLCLKSSFGKECPGPWRAGTTGLLSIAKKRNRFFTGRRLPDLSTFYGNQWPFSAGEVAARFREACQCLPKNPAWLLNLLQRRHPFNSSSSLTSSRRILHGSLFLAPHCPAVASPYAIRGDVLICNRNTTIVLHII